MKKIKEQKPIRCIAYLSVFGHDERVEEYEKKQLKKIGKLWNKWDLHNTLLVWDSLMLV